MMKKYDYSLKTWIIIAVMAVASLTVDILLCTGVIGGDNSLMKDTSMFTMIISGYILFESIRGIITKLKERNTEK